MSQGLLSIASLKKHFGGVKAVQDVSLDLKAGALQCIIGPNGAGKSTLFNMIAGTLQPTSGSIDFEGNSIIGLPLHRYARLGITRKFQAPTIFESMTVRDNLEVAAKDIPIGGRNDRLQQVLALVNLVEKENTVASELSHGQKQWLEIGMALMPAPKLLLLDEPTAGMTVEETQMTADMLLSLKGEAAIIVIEHDMQFIRALKSPTMVMHQGRVLCQGSLAELEQDQQVRECYLGKI